MDSQENSTTWVGNICKKVETLCSGIDNIMSQESFQYAENQLLSAGANVKQFTENQFLTAGANVQQFCSEFMQEMLPEFLKDPLQEKTPFLEDTEKCDISSSESLKKDCDEGHKDELSETNSCNRISIPGLPVVGKERSLEQNHVKVTLIPSDIPPLEALEKHDTGMPPSVCGVDQFHDGRIEDQIDLRIPESVLSQPLYSSAKAGGIAEPEDAKVDSLTVHQFATVSTGFDESKVPVNEVSSSAVSLSKPLNDSTESCSEFVEARDILAFTVLDGPSDSKAEKAKDNGISVAGMDVIEPLNMLAAEHDCPMLESNKICSASYLQVEDPTPQAMDNFPLKLKFEKGWEFIQTAGFEDHHVESDQPGGKSLKQSMQPREPKSNNNHDFSESDWEIV